MLSKRGSTRICGPLVRLVFVPFVVVFTVRSGNENGLFVSDP